MADLPTDLRLSKNKKKRAAREAAGFGHKAPRRKQARMRSPRSEDVHQVPPSAAPAVETPAELVCEMPPPPPLLSSPDTERVLDHEPCAPVAPAHQDSTPPVETESVSSCQSASAEPVVDVTSSSSTAHDECASTTRAPQEPPASSEHQERGSLASVPPVEPSHSEHVAVEHHETTRASALHDAADDQTAVVVESTPPEAVDAAATEAEPESIKPTSAHEPEPERAHDEVEPTIAAAADDAKSDSAATEISAAKAEPESIESTSAHEPEPERAHEPTTAAAADDAESDSAATEAEPESIESTNAHEPEPERAHEPTTAAAADDAESDSAATETSAATEAELESIEPTSAHEPEPERAHDEVEPTTAAAATETSAATKAEPESIKPTSAHEPEPERAHDEVEPTTAAAATETSAATKAEPESIKPTSAHEPEPERAHDEVEPTIAAGADDTESDSAATETSAATKAELESIKPTSAHEPEPERAHDEVEPTTAAAATETSAATESPSAEPESIESTSAHDGVEPTTAAAADDTESESAPTETSAATERPSAEPESIESTSAHDGVEPTIAAAADNTESDSAPTETSAATKAEPESIESTSAHEPEPERAHDEVEPTTAAAADDTESDSAATETSAATESPSKEPESTDSSAHSSGAAPPAEGEPHATAEKAERSFSIDLIERESSSSARFRTISEPSLKSFLTHPTPPPPAPAAVVTKHQGTEAIASDSTGDKPPAEHAVAAATLIHAYWAYYRARVECKKRRKMFAKRKMIATELRSTEEAYLHSLSTVCSRYLIPIRDYYLSACGEELGSLLTSLLSALELILSFHREFLKRLITRIDIMPWTPWSKISDIFLDMGVYLKMYSQYVNHYQKVVPLLAARRKVPKFEEVLTMLGSESDKRTMKDFLIMPVQRIPRYSMLLGDFIRNTWKDHGEYSDLLRAADTIGKIAETLENLSSEFEGIDKLMELASKFVWKKGESFKLVAPHRRFVMQVETMITQSNAMEAQTMFVFNDMLLWATPRKEQFHVSTTMSLATCSIFGAENKNSTSIMLSAGERTLMLTVSDVAVCQQLYRKIMSLQSALQTSSLSTAGGTTIRISQTKTKATTTATTKAVGLPASPPSKTLRSSSPLNAVRTERAHTLTHDAKPFNLTELRDMTKPKRKRTRSVKAEQATAAAAAAAFGAGAVASSSSSPSVLAPSSLSSSSSSSSASSGSSSPASGPSSPVASPTQVRSAIDGSPSLHRRFFSRKKSMSDVTTLLRVPNEGAAGRSSSSGSDPALANRDR